MLNTTALTTFMLQTSKDVFAVELLGSWDNFDKAYSLSRDRRAGKGHWTGCHRFENITCDGDLTDVHLKRDGALKMGGTYWYFYRLNGDMDYHDPWEPFTTTCPSLPGQTVNVLELPMLASSQTFSDHESLDALVFTLNPKDRYAPVGVKRTATTSAINKGKTPTSGDSGCGSEGRAKSPHNKQRSADDGLDSSKAPQSRQHNGLSSAFQKLRRTKSSIGSDGGIRQRPSSSWSRRLFSRARTAKGRTEEKVPQVPEVPLDILMQHGKQSPVTLPSPVSQCVIGSNASVSKAKISAASARSINPKTTRNNSDADPTQVVPVPDPATSGFSGSDSPRDTEVVDNHISQLVDVGVALTTTATTEDATATAMNIECARSSLSLATKQPSNDHDSHEECNASREAENGPAAYAESEAQSYTSTENCTPCLTSNTATSRRISSLVLSEPATPQLLASDEDCTPWQRRSDSVVDADCEDGIVAPSNACHLDLHKPAANSDIDPASSESTGFKGYSLPLRDHASSVTIRKLTSHENIPPLPLRRQASMQLVQSWDDGAQHHIGGLPNLMNDLGYLGTVIS